MSRVALLLITALLASTFVGGAAADDVPDPTSCTVEAWEDIYGHCVKCDEAFCEGLYADSEYYRKCSGLIPPAPPYEIWCTTDSDPTSCHIGRSPLLPPAAGLGLLLAGLAALWWTRRR